MKLGERGKRKRLEVLSTPPSFLPSLPLWDTCLSERFSVTLPPALFWQIYQRSTNTVSYSCCGLQTKLTAQQHRQVCVCVCVWPYDMTGLNGANQDLRDSKSPQDKLSMIACSIALTLHICTRPNPVRRDTQSMCVLKSWGTLEKHSTVSIFCQASKNSNRQCNYCNRPPTLSKYHKREVLSYLWQIRHRTCISSLPWWFLSVLSVVVQYLVVSFEAADHAGDLVDQAEVMDEVLQILVQLAWAHVQFV